MIALENVTLKVGNMVLPHLNWEIATGSYVALTGRSGCGKTTLLETIAGLRFATQGKILLHGMDVTQLPAHQRGIGYVPQDGAPFRTFTVAENLGFALTLLRKPKTEIEARVTELATWLGLKDILKRKARQLSGGETQRVALGRALAHKPRVLLLDEPLSAQDDDTRESLRKMLQEIKNTRNTTIVHVSHNRADFAGLADEEMGIHNGQLIKV